MENTILKLLNENPEEGMSLLMEQYMGLLWSACRLYLDNPEDIRECVQETFLDFYEHRNRFRTDKGTIKAYLYVIAKRKAIRAAGKNGKDAWLLLDENLADGQDMEEQLLNRAALEQALGRLKEQDSRMIRMKYYDGMTCEEIAHAMQLPLETVKKRQQRSLKKLRRILVAIALLALLTACAAVAVYRIRFSPVTGIQNTEDAVWYEMANAPAVIGTAQGEVMIQNVVWKDEKLIVQLEFESEKFPEESTDLKNEVWFEGSNSGGNPRRYTSGSTTACDGSLEHAELTFSYISEKDVREQYRFHIFDEVYAVDMKPIDEYADFQDIGNSESHNGRTIVLQTERMDEKLLADAYVYSEDVWKITGLNDYEDFYEDSGYIWGQKQLVGGRAFHYEAEVPKEESYTLEIETLVLQSQGETPTVQIPIPEDSVNVDIPFTLGKDTYRVSEVRWSRGTGEYGIGSSDEDMQMVSADELFIKIEPVELEENTRLFGVYASLGRNETRYTYLYNPDTKKLEVKDEYEQFHSITDNMFGQYSYFYQNEDYVNQNCICLLITDPDELQGNISLRINSIYKFWDQNYTFKIK